MSVALFLLFESASGYALFEVKGIDEVGQSIHEVRKSVIQFDRFLKVARLIGFKPFESATDALEQVNAISESQMTDSLKAFLTVNLPKVPPISPRNMIDVNILGENHKESEIRTRRERC